MRSLFYPLGGFHMILNVAICDDEENDIDIISDYLFKYQMIHDVDFNISRLFQLLFIDVEMPELSGLDVAKRIRKLPDRDVTIVFVSNYPEYMQNSFDVQAFQYLSKPLSYEKFNMVMNNIIEDFNSTHTVQFIIKTDLSEEVIYLHKIIYIHTIDAHLKRLEIVLEDHSIETIGTLSEWEISLKDYNFILSHRGYLVNTSQIHYFEDKKLIMNNGDAIPVSRRKEKEIRTLFAHICISGGL